MSHVENAGKRRASESEDDRETKQAKTSNFGDIEPRMLTKSLDNVTATAPGLPESPTTSPCPDVSRELYDKIQGMRVPPGSTSGLSNIVGCAKGKRMIEYILLATIERPEYARTGQLQKGVLLHGPPGTGKTTLVLAAASKPNSPAVYLVSSAVIKDQIHGNSEKNIAALYVVAAHNAPAIIFSDDIDLFCTTGTPLLATLKIAMDSCPSNIVTIGASSLPKFIDKGLLSRLTKKILVTLPSEKDLASMWELKVSAWPHSLSHDEFDVLGQLTKTYGLSGRDIEAAARRTRRILNFMMGPSPSHYRAVQVRGEEYLCVCSPDHPAACAVNGRAEISKLLNGRPTSLDDLVATVQNLR